MFVCGGRLDPGPSTKHPKKASCSEQPQVSQCCLGAFGRSIIAQTPERIQKIEILWIMEPLGPKVDLDPPRGLGGLNKAARLRNLGSPLSSPSFTLPGPLEAGM